MTYDTSSLDALPSRHSLKTFRLVQMLPPAPVQPDWDRVDVLLLDMDGTLLDLQFDNYFWLELLPERFALQHGLSLAQARAVLTPRFAAHQGTLDWYCTDFWSRELALDVAALKREVRERIRFLPRAEQFLSAARRAGLPLVLATNAHRDTLAVKAEHTGLLDYLDLAVSSHDYGFPKEDARFWERLQSQLEFDPARVLFIDDSLAVLRAARAYGIGQLLAVAHPDTTQPMRQVSEFSVIEGVGQLIATLPDTAQAATRIDAR